MNSLLAYGSDSDEEGQHQQSRHGQSEPDQQPREEQKQRGNGGLAGQLSSSSSSSALAAAAAASVLTEAAPLEEPRPPRRQSDMFDEDDDEADVFGSERQRNDEDDEEEELDLLLEKGAKFSDSAMLDVGGSSGGGGSTPGPGYTPRSVCSADEPMDEDMAAESSADAIQHRDLPPSPRGECDPELAQRFVAFFEKKERGVDMHASIKRRKDYINPALYEALRNAYGIDEKGTCFARAVYDPNAFAAGDFYDALGDHQAVLEQRRKKMVQQQQQQEQHQHSSSKRPASFPTGGGKAK
ncbi:hypothetical protein niasHT_025618 [Heterodera trifolii]|uniref:SAP30-binding protein n=1 Tax=Heterodera trifolii TaxID=157864 RepID=A0ABD2KHP2_9BILA